MNKIRQWINKIINLKYLNRFIKIINRPEMRVLPGSIAYFLVMSIVPALLIFAIICSRISISLVDIMDVFNELIPKDVLNLLYPVVSNIKTDNLSIWYVIIGIVLASNGTHAIILASNTLYGVENNNYFIRRIKSLILILILMFVFMFILVVVAFGNTILSLILELKIFSEISVSVYSTFVVLKWPLAILVISLLIKILYTIAPDKKMQSRYVNKGVAFTTVCWILSTAVYSYYANNMANYNLLYGSLSSIVVLMIWIYVMAYILVIGIAINTNNYKIAQENNILQEK